MVKWFKYLKTAAKLDLSFGLVGVMFAAVVWMYKSTLTETTATFDKLCSLGRQTNI